MRSLEAARAANELRGVRIAAWHNLPSGGGLRAFVAHVVALRDAGAEVEVFVPPSANRTFFELPQDVRQTVVPYDVPSTSRLLRGPFRVYSDGSARLHAMDTHAERVARLVESGGFDLLFDNSCQFFRAAPIAAHCPTIPSLLYLQEPFRWFYEALPTLPWVTLGSSTAHRRPTRDRLRELGELAGIRRQATQELEWVRAHDVVLVNSLFSRESVMRCYRLKSRVCYLGVAATPAAFARTRENYVLAVGAFTAEKNPILIIRAVAAANRAGRRLVWIADHVNPQVEASANELAGQLGVSLLIEKAVTDERLQFHLATARVFAYAPHLEPFGLAPLEAMMAGLPVVAVAEGGVRETVVHGVSGLIANPDEVAMGAAIDLLWDQSPARDALIKSALLFVEQNFDEESAAARFVAEVRATLSASKSKQ